MDLNAFHLTHVASSGGWDEAKTSECRGVGDFGRKLYTNCTLEGTFKYIERKNYECNVLVLPFEEDILYMPVGTSTWNNRLSVYCFGYYAGDLDDEHKVLFCRTVYDHRRNNAGSGIDANIIIGPRADGYIDSDLDFIGEHYYDEPALIGKYDDLMKADYEPQIAFDQTACDALFYAMEKDDWIECNEYIRFFV